jgi:uncharacterized protein (DUF1697 family)
METYIAILWGINVSGQKLIKMAALKVAFEEAGFRNVMTYIQSGNIIFRSEGNNEDVLALRVSKLIRDNFGFEVPVIIRTSTALAGIISSNPFLKEKGILEEKLHVTFLSEAPDKTRQQELEKLSFGNERFVIQGREICLYCPNGYGNTKLSNNFFENKLKITATTRNWSTVNKLAGLLSNI